MPLYVTKNKLTCIQNRSFLLLFCRRREGGRR